ncbi:MAG TPA: sigma-54 dependent transcriptional regulator [Vicinamibacterales bacterium]
MELRTGLLTGCSPQMRALEEDLRDAARSDAKVLITGESGVGKEIAARTVHAFSSRSAGRLVTLNSAGVPDSLLESELFGHMRGSFTGAYRDKPGIFELARRGTVLLDEVGEMSLRMQSLLLRFLETGEIQPVGGDRPRYCVDVRVIAMTNRQLLEQIAQKQFREDLYYRLNVIHIVVPPLRERREDVPVLARHFLKTCAEQYGLQSIELTPEAETCLLEYHWPGNVRELKNVIERCVVRLRTSTITARDLPSEVLYAPRQVSAAAPSPAPQSLADAAFERLVKGGESFWSAVYAPFMTRDLTRADLRRIVTLGLEQTRGSYTLLVQLFNMKPDDYKRFLNFLRKHQCRLPYQNFRVAGGRLSTESDEITPAQGAH